MADLQPSTGSDVSNFANLPFKVAAEIWLGSRNRIAPRTRGMYLQYIKVLNSYFADMPLSEIRIQHVQDFQKRRTAGTIFVGRKAGPAIINHECNTLSQILTKAELWDPIKKWYEPFLTPPTKGIAISTEQQDRLFALAKTKMRWRVAYYCSLITANTAAGPGEIRHLRFRDCDFVRKVIHVREGVKNGERVRTLELNPDACAAVVGLYELARKKGCSAPNHYLIPARASAGDSGFNPLKPQGDWRSAWEKLRNAAGMPHLRMYDLRHTAATNMVADSETSELTAVAIMGHTDPKMLRKTYSHIGSEDRRAALNRLNRGYESEMFERRAREPEPASTPVPQTQPGRIAAAAPGSFTWSSFSFAPNLAPAEPTKEKQPTNLHEMPKRSNSA